MVSFSPHRAAWQCGAARAPQVPVSLTAPCSLSPAFQSSHCTLARCQDRNPPSPPQGPPGGWWRMTQVSMWQHLFWSGLLVLGPGGGATPEPLHSRCRAAVHYPDKQPAGLFPEPGACATASLCLSLASGSLVSLLHLPSPAPTLSVPGCSPSL